MYHPSHHGFQSLFLYYTLNSSKIVQTQWRDSSPPSWGSSRAAPARAPPRRWAPGARAPSYFAPPPTLSSARRPFKTKKGKIFKRNKIWSGFHLCSFCSTSPFSRVSWSTPALQWGVMLISSFPQRFNKNNDDIFTAITTTTVYICNKIKSYLFWCLAVKRHIQQKVPVEPRETIGGSDNQT